MLAGRDLTAVLLVGCGTLKHTRTVCIGVDQRAVIRQALTLLRSKGRHRPACFGIQPSDTSDCTKAAEFSELVSPEDVYYAPESLEDCFGRFYERIDTYDSVICDNDYAAVYLLKRCRELGIAVPERLNIIGNGNLWISSHVKPAITTFSGDMSCLIEVLQQLTGGKNGISMYSSADILLVPRLSARDSTGDSWEDTDADYPYKPVDLPSTEPETRREICRIRDLDALFSGCGKTSGVILRGLLQGLTYEQIAAGAFLSIDSVRYHAKKLYAGLGIHSRKELCVLAEGYGIVL